jgi:S1-C subfamily serine protease
MWSRGTGAKLATGDVLTAHHVAENAIGCVLNGEDGVTVGQASQVNQPVAGRDLVHVTDITWTPAGLALPGFEVKKAATPAVGALVLMASFPGAITRSLQLTFGYVTSSNVTASLPLDYRSYWSAAWSSDNASTNGSSGGPVFDSNGDLIAIVVGRPNDDSLDLRFSLPLIW